MTNSDTCGLDEAGRGPLAGPVAAACVVLPPDFPIAVLHDSKKMTQRAREAAFELILAKAKWGLGWSEPAEIDQINILQASLMAMTRAFEDLQNRFPGTVILNAIVDGLHKPKLPVACQAMARADALVPSVSAASIVAKVSRDRFMEQAHANDPRYGFSIHKGYPTEAHRRALVEFGPGPLHRLTFQWKRPPSGGLS